RNKTSHHGTVPTVTYPLWATTFSELQKARSGGPLVLLSPTGHPLWTTSLTEGGHLSQQDQIANLWWRARRVVGVNKPLKKIRKMSAALIHQHHKYSPVAPLFLGHAAGNIHERHHVRARQDLLIEAVGWLGEYLGQTR